MLKKAIKKIKKASYNAWFWKWIQKWLWVKSNLWINSRGAFMNGISRWDKANLKYYENNKSKMSKASRLEVEWRKELSKRKIKVR